MVNIGRLIGRTCIVILLIVLLLGFVLSYSVNQNLHVGNAETIAEDVATEFVKDQLMEQVSGEGEDLYNDLQLECKEKETITLENFDIELNCNEIKEIGEDEFDKFLTEKIENEIGSSIQEEVDESIDDTKINNLVSWIAIAMWSFGIVSAVLIFLLFLISFHKHKFFMDLGIAALIAGIPFVGFINLEYNNYNNAASDALVNYIFNSLYWNLMFLFGVGVLFLGIGIWRRHTYKKSDGGDKPKEKKDKKDSEKKKKSRKKEKNDK